MYKYLKKDENFHVCKIKYISVSIKKIVEWYVYLFILLNIPYIFHKDIQYTVFIFFSERKEVKEETKSHDISKRIEFNFRISEEYV